MYSTSTTRIYLKVCMPVLNTWDFFPFLEVLMDCCGHEQMYASSIHVPSQTIIPALNDSSACLKSSSNPAGTAVFSRE